MADGALLGLLMTAVADEMAEGIDRRLADIEEMKQILAACQLSDDETEILQQPLTGYNLKAVNDHHDAVTRILINWHEQSETVESLGGLNTEIWHYLRRHSERHTIQVPGV